MPLQLIANTDIQSATTFTFSNTQFGLGSAASPSIAFTGDTNTGIFSPAADTLAFAEGGTEVMRINSSGNIGIGTTSPSTKLEVNGGASSGIFRVSATGHTGLDIQKFVVNSDAIINLQDNGNLRLYTNNTERMRIDSLGNVGIGTASPFTYGKLAVVGAATTEGYAVNTATTGQASWWALNNTPSRTGVFQYGTSQAAYGAIGSGEGALYSSTNLTVISDTGVVKFATGGNTERMRIDSSGNVGIGTTSPGAKLSLTSTGNTTADGVRLTFGSEARPHNIYSDLSTGRDLLIAPWRAVTLKAGSGTTEGEVRLQSYESTIISTGSSYTERMRIDTSGNVGIGTSSPGAGIKLDVLGGEIRAGRVDTSSEGGQVSFSRSSDNATAWYLDVFGNTSTPSFRFVDVSAGAVRATIDSSGNFQFNSGYGSVATAYACRAWVNFNGTSTVAIRSSGNVSSITDNGTGDYTVNLTTAMPDGNYSAVSSGGTGGNNIRLSSCSPVTTTSTSQIRVIGITINAGSLIDLEVVSVAIFR